MIRAVRFKGFAAMGLLLAVSLVACHREEQAVAGVAQKAANAERQVQAAETLRDQQRAQLAHIPLPTKSLYIDIHEPAAWANPFLSVEADMIDLQITLSDANPSTAGQGTMLRPTAARRQEIKIRPAELSQAVIALPDGAWRYGRVVAVAEAPGAPAKQRPQIRRNVEAAIQKLNDLGIVVEEWPSR